jgi:hypothetical protein
VLPPPGLDFLALFEQSVDAAALPTPAPLAKTPPRFARPKEDGNTPQQNPLPSVPPQTPIAMPATPAPSPDSVPAGAASTSLAAMPLPAAPDDTRVEILRQPAPAAGTCAFQLKLADAGKNTTPASTAQDPTAVNATPPRDHNTDGDANSNSQSPWTARAPEKKDEPVTDGANPPANPPVANLTAAPQLPAAAPAIADSPRTQAPQPVAAPPEVVEKHPTAAPAQQIALRVSTADDRSVDVRLISRAGDVHVSVHTPDETLARAMRTELGSLTGKLAQAGYAVQTAAPVRDSAASFSERRGGKPSEEQARNPQDRNQQSPQHQNRRGRKSAWLLAQEESEE